MIKKSVFLKNSEKVVAYLIFDAERVSNRRQIGCGVMASVGLRCISAIF
jgi:hypothetical protein